MSSQEASWRRHEEVVAEKNGAAVALRGCWKCLENRKLETFILNGRFSLVSRSRREKRSTQQARSLESLREVFSFLLRRFLLISVFLERSAEKEEARFSGRGVIKSVWSRCWKEQSLSPYIPPHRGMPGMPGLHSTPEQRR